MKKLISSLAAFFVGAALFAGIPSNELIAGVYDFATTESPTWKIYDGHFTTIDTVNEEYVFIGGFVVKILIGYSRYDFTCKVTNGDSDFNLELSDVISYASDKNGNMLKNSTVVYTSKRVSSQYADQMKTEIKNRIEEFKKNGTMEEVYTKTVTSPAFLDFASASMSKLALKKFVEENVNGKNVSFEVTLKSVDENVHPMQGMTLPHAYKAVGTVEVFEEKRNGVVFTSPYLIFIYSNNDELLSAKIGSTYKVNGKVEFKELGYEYWNYTVEEE